ncbi:hypothetical protein, conserved [Trypanosoma brucei gambiense DAL972]|uniref:Sperm-tail PG-rich repeat n=1 Tax=Trypanosoma brucei gambiense (strain MHOM/CI/86/DAL972) TaxID=679716 RepID=C9ZYT8_TRYB9|nr:hypothetical protein, conserved [Trypanosoma brucei gambiense DAL972]CBH14587.1 hypothetical protein, conserved [Trypanosoma brucei gambiense DAL972]|eukprot:XP_011776853.1 hypothetical protein, conserved [Trypanosoma brucei gambiense DAL972]
MSYLVEELPLSRAKVPGICAGGCTGPGVGPGSYDINVSYQRSCRGMAPFGSTSKRFGAEAAAAIPGVGTYNITPADLQKGCISTVPFNSKVERFAGYGAIDFPGPGAYTVDGHPTKRRSRSHPIRFSRQPDTTGHIAPGPGYYDPNCKHRRSKSGTLCFDEYSGRKPLETNKCPGPGHYESAGSFTSIYNRKPTISFTSKTERSQNGGGSGNPGPGAYNLPSVFRSKEQYRAANPETLIAFGTKSARDGPYGPNPYPGPGAYTGEIAPRRPHVHSEEGRCKPFISVSERIKYPARSNIGPGSYDAQIPRKGPKYQLASVPFWSNVARFPTPKPAEERDDLVPHREAERVPRRIHPLRVLNEAVSEFIKPKAHQGTMNFLDDEHYDFIKPKCTSGGYLGSAPRLTSTATRSDYPGPGQYDVCHDSSFGRASSGRSKWGCDGRFKRTVDRFPGPGHYSCDTTFLKKSFNRTINQSDNM